MNGETGLNPWLGRPHFHWAHQGGAREAPSNTLRAMEAGLKAGADGLEFDVHRTRDRVVVLMHDKTLDRTTNAEAAKFAPGTLIRKRRLSDLTALDAAYWWVPGQVDDHDAPEEAYELRGRVVDDRDLGIPTLDEVLTRFPGPYTIEVKDKRAVDGTIRLLESHGVPADQVIVTSFRRRTVRALRRRISRSASDFGVAPAGIPTIVFFIRSGLGWTPSRYPYVAIQPPPVLRASALPPPMNLLAKLLPRRWRQITIVDQRFLNFAATVGIAVHVWTINRRSDMQALDALGVHGIMTDCPSVLTDVLTNG